jgi:Putative amidoligase enzyme
MSSTTVIYAVGNTYQKIPSHRAKLDRSGKFKKVHDVTLYLDVLEGNPDVIQRVTFDLGATFQPRSFACACPTQVKRPDGTHVWRFSSRQQVYGSVVVKISLLGGGGTHSEGQRHAMVLGEEANGATGKRFAFVEHSAIKPLPLMKVDPTQKFGIELELTSPALDISVEQIASNLTSRLKGRFGRIVVIQSYAEGHGTANVWKMVPDGSIVCSRDAPSCTKFELVSPVLEGGSGLNQASQVLDGLNKTSLQINKSMGFHVHVDVSKLSVQDLIKVCQNCIKYEDVIDALVPPSRRTGSLECDKYFKSNREALRNVGYTSNRERHNALGRCTTTNQLAELMNPNGSRYHKVNLQNLITGRQPTIEFRQHSATANAKKVNNWVRFCITLVTNSAHLASPSPFREGKDIDAQFEALFQFVVKDRALREYYRGRRKDLKYEEDSCCQNCSSGRGVCQSDTRRREPKVAYCF